MTSNSKELIDLAERCEKATGPDRLLDAEIYCIKVVENNKTVYRARPGRKPGTVICYYFDNGPLTHGTRKAPKFTSSIDVAMTLVPEGLDFTLDRIASEALPPCNSSVGGKSGNAATPALALCAAALRAEGADHA